MDDIQLLYYSKKNRCPRCNSKNLVDTDITKLNTEIILKQYKEFRDRKNKTACKDCNWIGLIDDLKR